MKMSYYNFLKNLSLIMLLLLFLSVNNTFAQEETEAEVEEVAVDTSSSEGGFLSLVKWGPKGGFTLSNFYDDREDISDYTPGFTVGVSAGVPYMDWLEFGFEVLYSHQGARDVAPRLLYSNMLDFENQKLEKMDVVLHTLEIPVLLTYYVPIGKDPNVKPMITVGHSFGLNLYAESKCEWTRSDNTEFHASDNVTERFQTQNFAVIGGLGVEFKNKTLPIWYTAELRYRLGYSDMGNMPIPTRSDVEAYDDFNNNMLQFTMGIKF